MVTLSKYKWELKFAGIALVIVLLDQFLKYLVLTFNPSLDLKIILIHLVQNTGAGFGIFKNQAIWLGIISLCATLLVLFNYKKIDKQYSSQILWAVFLGGVVGNMLDRFFRGYVIDFIDFGWWPAFNLADACLTISVIGLIILYWKKDKS